MTVVGSMSDEQRRMVKIVSWLLFFPTGIFVWNATGQPIWSAHFFMDLLAATICMVGAVLLAACGEDF